MTMCTARPLALTASGVFVVLLLAGCGEYRLPTTPVSGQITVNGEPAAGAQIVLVPTGGPAKEAGVSATAKSEADGSFTISSAYDTQSGDGAVQGTYKVAVFWTGPPVEGEDPEAAAPTDRPSAIPEEYNQADTTPLDPVAVGPDPVTIPIAIDFKPGRRR